MIQQVDPVTGQITAGTGAAASTSADQFSSSNAEVFQSSDLTKPSSASDPHFGTQAMDQSQGSGSGQLSVGKAQISNDAQWIRAFSLIVYGHSVVAGGSVGFPNVADTKLNPTPPSPSGRVVPFRRPGTQASDFNPLTQNPSASTSASTQNQQQLPGLDLSNLRCVFNVIKHTLQNPNMLYARIYNASPETMAKVISFTRIQVNAGYKYANFGLIFDGEVIQYRRGKENPVDTYIEIHAGDGDAALTGTTLFKAYPAGTKERQVLDDLNAKKKQIDPNFKVGTIDSKAYQDKFLRDKVIVGNAKNIERHMFLASGMQHWVDNNALMVVSQDGYKAGEAVVLSPNTGLVGLPEVTPQGIQVKCLLNPKLKLGGLVQIDSNLLSGVAYTPGSDTKVDAKGNVTGGETGGKIYNYNMWRQNLETAYTSPIGLYKILLMTYTGDTRGNPWYCDLVCVAMDSDGKAIVHNNISNVWLRRAAALAKQGTEAK